MAEILMKVMKEVLYGTLIVGLPCGEKTQLVSAHRILNNVHLLETASCFLTAYSQQVVANVLAIVLCRLLHQRTTLLFSFLHHLATILPHFVFPFCISLGEFVSRDPKIPLTLSMTQLIREEKIIKT